MQDIKTIEEQIGILNQLKEKGLIIMIKLDGERTKNKITALIDFPEHPGGNKMIRVNGEKLNLVLNELLVKYELQNFSRRH